METAQRFRERLGRNHQWYIDNPSCGSRCSSARSAIDANYVDSFASNSNTVAASMGILLSDTNGNGTSIASDVAQTKAQLGQGVTSSNFRTYVNADGTINA